MPVEWPADVEQRVGKLDVVLAEQEWQNADKVGDQDEGSSDLQQVVGNHNVCHFDVDKVAGENGEKLVYKDELRNELGVS